MFSHWKFFVSDDAACVLTYVLPEGKKSYSKFQVVYYKVRREVVCVRTMVSLPRS